MPVVPVEEVSVSDTIQALVLDDEAIVRQRLEDYLTKKGVAVETFGDSAEAIERLRQRSFDVVITDLKMRGPSGLDVLHEVKSLELPTQVILMTGYGSIEAAREAEMVGAFEFIDKPFEMASMLALVKKAAKRARKQRK